MADQPPEEAASGTEERSVDHTLATDSTPAETSFPGPSEVERQEVPSSTEYSSAGAALQASAAVAVHATVPIHRPPQHYHAHSHSHSHSHAPPPTHHHHQHSHLPGGAPPTAQPPLRPIQAHRQRTVRVPVTAAAMPQAQTTNSQLGQVRDRLFQAMLVRMALWYTSRVNRRWRKVIELIAIAMAILSFLSLATIHGMFMRVSTTCLKDIEPTWPREGILRVEVIRNLEMLRKKEAQYDEFRKDYLSEKNRTPPPVCRFSQKEVLMRGPAVLPAEIREFGYSTRPLTSSSSPSPSPSPSSSDPSLFNTIASYVYPEVLLEVEPEDIGLFDSLEDEEELAMQFDADFNNYYDAADLPYSEYRVEYSLIYGLLRLPHRFLAKHNVTVMLKQIDANDVCLGSPAARWLMANVIGYEDPVLHTLKALAVNESDIGYVHDLRAKEHYHFVQLQTSKMSYVTSGVVMLLFTFAISLLLRFSHHQIFLFIVDLLHMFEHNQPLAFPAAPLLTVILALVGMEAIMSEVFNDTTTAFYVILIVWLADQFDAICCQSPTSKRYWLRFFFLNQFFFYCYQYRFGGVYGGVALLTSSLFTLHSMIFFFHHYEIPLILYTDRLQRIMGELNGREVNVATGREGEAGGEGGTNGGADGNRIRGDTTLSHADSLALTSAALAARAAVLRQRQHVAAAQLESAASAAAAAAINPDGRGVTQGITSVSSEDFIENELIPIGTDADGSIDSSFEDSVLMAAQRRRQETGEQQRAGAASSGNSLFNSIASRLRPTWMVAEADRLLQQHGLRGGQGEEQHQEEEVEMPRAPRIRFRLRGPAERRAEGITLPTEEEDGDEVQRLQQQLHLQQPPLDDPQGHPSSHNV